MLYLVKAASSVPEQAKIPALTNYVARVQLTTSSFDEIVGIFVSGAPADKIKVKTRTRAMVARGGRMALTDPQIQAVAAYVYTLSHK